MSKDNEKLAQLKETYEMLKKLGMGEEVLAPLRKEIADLGGSVDANHQTTINGGLNTGGGDFVGRDKIITIYQGRYEGQEPRTEAEQRHIYCQFIAQQAGVLPLRGMDRKESDAGSERGALSLAGVYTNLDIQFSAPEKAIAEMLAEGGWKKFEIKEQGRKPERRIEPDDEDKMRPVSAVEAAVLSRKWVLLGDPGSGKTTFVNYLTQALASEDFEHLSTWPQAERDILPIVVVFRDFHRWVLTRGKDVDRVPCANLLWQYILHDLKIKNLSFAAPLVEHALENGNAMLMLDGLDEVPPGDARQMVRECILAFHARYGHNRFLVTCRVLSYEEKRGQLPEDDFPAFELAPFSKGKIDDFIRAWYNEVARKWNVPEERTTRLADKLLGALNQSEDLARLAPNPLLLTVMALVHTEYGELPDNRAQLYLQAVDVLLWRWEQEKSKENGELSMLMVLLQEAGRDRNDLLIVLGRLAFEAHRNGGDTEDRDAVSGITQTELLASLRELHPQRSLDWAEKVLHAMRLRAGLLLDRDGTTFTFPHRTFQEYLAGTHLASMPDFPTEAVKLADEGSFWRVVILLAVGHLAHNNINRTMPLMLTSELCPEDIKNDETGWMRLVLAGETLLELGVNRAQDSETGRSVLKRMRARLMELVEGGLWKAKQRAEAGDVLGQLGDPRFDPQKFYLPGLFHGKAEAQYGFLKIPAGSFIMGSKEDDEGSFDDEYPQHQVDISYDYWMARYPVTVAQFKAFVEDSNYQVKFRRCIQENPNWPVCDVSWYEARAYCEWLFGKLTGKLDFAPRGYVLRLPTEAEWEKAVRGTQGNIYPWGNEWKEDAANTEEAELKQLSPAGIFPAGWGQEFGLLDGAGNLWEWTLSQFQPYTYIDEDGRNDLGSRGMRVLRGGSWGSVSRLARCAFRSGSSPVRCSSDVGFRMALSPDIPWGNNPLRTGGAKKQLNSES